MMTRGILTKTGSFLVAALLALFVASPAWSAEVDTELAHARIAVGDTTVLKVKISQAADIEPVTIPSVKGLEISYAGMGRSIEIVNWKKTVSSVFSFHVTAFKKGAYTIPPFTFKVDGSVYKSRAVKLVVTKSLPAQQREQDRGTDGRTDIRTIYEVSTEKVYAGEPVIIRYYLLIPPGGRFRFEGFEKDPETKGFVGRSIDEALDPVIVTVEGIEYEKEHLKTYILIPTSDGVYETGGGTGVVSYEDRRSFFPFTRQGRIFFESSTIEVMKLPVHQVPAGYKGSIGNFTMELDYSPDPVQIYAEKKIRLTVSGTGNLITLEKPLLGENVEGVKIISEDGRSDLSIKDDNLQGSREFIFTVIPEQSGAIDLGPFSLIYFNTGSKKFETLRSENVVITVQGQEKAGTRIDFDSDEKKIDYNPFIIAGILLVVAGMVFVIVLWERKRYRLVIEQGQPQQEEEQEARPEISISELKAELARSIRSGDTRAFLKSAEKALGSLDINALSADESDMVNYCRDTVYRAQFGGGTISEEGMREIQQKIEKLLK